MDDGCSCAVRCPFCFSIKLLLSHAHTLWLSSRFIAVYTQCHKKNDVNGQDDGNYAHSETTML